MIKLFKTIATFEGLSLLALLFFAMPMKYIYNDKVYVKHIGMVHGILFIAYIFLAVFIKNRVKWNVKSFFIVCIASIIPFGTFYIEKKYLKNENI